MCVSDFGPSTRSHIVMKSHSRFMMWIEMVSFPMESCSSYWKWWLGIISRSAYVYQNIFEHCVISSLEQDQQLQQIVDKTIMEGDLDRDGKLSFEEFAQMVSNTVGGFFFVSLLMLSLVTPRTLSSRWRLKTSSDNASTDGHWRLLIPRCVYVVHRAFPLHHFPLII